MNASYDPWGKVPEIDGAALLDDVERFVGRFVAYPSGHALVAHVLWIAHTWLMDSWESTPRIAFLSPEPGSGKSRALEVTEPLVPRAVHAVNTTPAYLFRKVSDPEGTPTILYDEIDTVFGPKAKDNEDVRGMLNAGHRRGATAGRCVVRGKVIETEELPAYSAVALAGLNDLPDTLMTRSVVVRMRRRAPAERIEPWRLRVNGTEAGELRERLEAWADQARPTVTGAWPAMPDGIEDRDADVWEALLAVADAARGTWPQRARAAAVTLVTASRDGTPSLGVMLLKDLRKVFTKAGTDKLSTEAILEALHGMDESPWADLRGKPLDARGLAQRLSKYSEGTDNRIRSKTIRAADKVFRGYDAGDLADPWARYLTDDKDHDDEDQGAGMVPDTSVTSVTAVTPAAPQVTEVTDVTHPAPAKRTANPPVSAHEDPPCMHCGKEMWAPRSIALGVCGNCVAAGLPVPAQRSTG